MKAVNADPTANIDLIRKDLRLFDNKTWDTIDDVAENVWKEQNKGAYAMYKLAKINKHVAECHYAWGTTAMSGADGYVNSSMASMVARIRAYDNLLSRVLNLLLKPTCCREGSHATMFDETGRMMMGQLPT